MSTETQFEQPGSLSSPGPIGRLVRLALGLWITYAFFQFMDIGFLDAQIADRFFPGGRQPTHLSGCPWRSSSGYFLMWSILALVETGVGKHNGSWWGQWL